MLRRECFFAACTSVCRRSGGARVDRSGFTRRERRLVLLSLVLVLVLVLVLLQLLQLLLLLLLLLLNAMSSS